MPGRQRFAQISDLHLSSLAGVTWRDLANKRLLGYLSWRRKRRFEHRREVLDALREDLRNAQLSQVLITGDLTHIGLPMEFLEVRDWLRQLGRPEQVALVPGNHDAYLKARWDETFALWQEYMAADDLPAGTGDFSAFPTFRVRGDLAFIGLSTACPTPPLLATGTAAAGQLERLPALLTTAAQQGLFRVLYLHHSPLPGVHKWRKRLTNADRVRAVIEERGVELIVHGHGHRAHASSLSTSHGAAAVFAVPSASAMGLHGADTAGYNCYEVTRTATGWQLGVEARDYSAETGSFTTGKSQRLDLERPR
jgi:3',5'-cyclic AMP phosphodiesterase CpdA